jgi:hypothetical protein
MFGSQGAALASPYIVDHHPFLLPQPTPSSYHKLVYTVFQYIHWSCVA